MPRIDEETVIDFYLALVEDDKINFLEGKEEKKERISEKLKELRDERGLHDRIEVARVLWKLLFESSMEWIDQDKQGYEELFDYFDAYVDFEELIFASDAFYRDHTLHCLWVYLLIEYIFRKEEFRPLFVEYQAQLEYLSEIGELFKEMDSATLKRLGESIYQISEQVEHDEAIRCVSSLAHDLGYPLKKIADINKAVTKILPYYSIRNFGEFEFQYEGVQNISIEKFLELLSFSYSTDIKGRTPKKSTPLLKEFQMYMDKYNQAEWMEGKSGKEYKEKILDIGSRFGEEEVKILQENLSPDFQIVKNPSRFANLADDFENYRHGIMSAYLLRKMVKAFSNIRIPHLETGEIQLQPSEFPKMFSKLMILASMAHHTHTKISINRIDEVSSLLILVDEIEEFSRISRAAQQREYVEQFCETDLSYEEGYMNIHFIFDKKDTDVLDPEFFFKDKCRKFLRLFDIPRLAPYLNINLTCTDKLTEDAIDYCLTIRRGEAEIKVADERKEIKRYLDSIEFDF